MSEDKGPTTEEKIRLIRKKDRRFASNAYWFFTEEVMDYIGTKYQRRIRRGHRITAQNYLESFREFAFEKMGELALLVMNYWGLTNTQDIAELVWNAFEAKLLSKDDNDSKVQFGNEPLEEMLSSRAYSSYVERTKPRKAYQSSEVEINGFEEPPGDRISRYFESNDG